MTPSARRGPRALEDSVGLFAARCAPARDLVEALIAIGEDGYLAERPAHAPDHDVDVVGVNFETIFARLLDTLVAGSAVWFAVGILLAATSPAAQTTLIEFLTAPGGMVANGIGTIFFAIIPNAMEIGLTGSSVGKFIFGISVVGPDGKVIGLRKAFQRELLVWVHGFGLGLPIVSLFTLAGSAGRLSKKRETSWDERLSVRINCRPNSADQLARNVFGIVVILAFEAYLRSPQ